MNYKSCPKAGIKIHSSDNDLKHGYNDDQISFYNKIKSQNKDTGVRITDNKNHYEIDPFDGANPFNNPEGEEDFKNIIYNSESYNKLDLNIANYSHNDIYTLFGIKEQLLSHEIMKKSKKTVLKTHPDKSRLEPKYFLFFKIFFYLWCIIKNKTLKIIIMNPRMLKYLAERKVKQMAEQGIKITFDEALDQESKRLTKAIANDPFTKLGV